MRTTPAGLLLLATIVGSTSPALAATPQDGAALDERQFVEHVLSSSLAAREAEEEAALERAPSAGAGLWSNPSLEWERESGAQTQDKLMTRISLSVSGRPGLEREVAELRVQAADARLSRARAVLHRRAILAFAAARAAQERARILEESRAALAEVTRAVAARERAGDVAGYERLRIELEGATADGLWREAQLERSRAESRALVLLGPRAGPLPALTGAMAPPRALPPLAELADRLPALRADLRALSLEAEAAERARSAAARSWIPDPVVGGGPMLLQGDTGFAVTLSVPIPLFQRGQGEGALASAQAALAQTRRALAIEEARSTLPAEHGLAQGRREQLERHRREVLARARELRQVAAAAYRGGASDLLVLVDAERAWREAQLREVELAESTTATEADLLLLAGLLDAPTSGSSSR